ncbi:MAG: hypothetical protein ACTIKR_16595 [Advenella sp.]|nr:hypothetical protein [Advenella sp. FME57]
MIPIITACALSPDDGKGLAGDKSWYEECNVMREDRVRVRLR